MNVGGDLRAFATRLLDLLAEEIDSVEYDGRPSARDVSTDSGRDEDSIHSALLSAARRQTTHNGYGNGTDHASQLRTLCSIAYEGMKSAHKDLRESHAWRRLYTDAALVWAMLDCLEGGEDEQYWLDVVSRLDTAIIVSACPGNERHDLVLQAIRLIQSTYLSRLDLQCESAATLPPPPPLVKTHDATPTLPSASSPIPSYTSLLSLSTFCSKVSHAPFILRGAATDWPALSKGRKWASKAYLIEAAGGRGRVVPLEIGADYRTDDWSQCIASWDEFLDYLFCDPDSTPGTAATPTKKQFQYLAQHDLFNQFPALRDDILIPDYIYSSLPAPSSYPSYQPPGNEEQLVTNVWVGPMGAMSPAHIDPYFNFYS